MGPSRLRYGTRRGQRADLWRPADRDSDGSLPVVVLIHGGFWRSPYTKVLMTRLARSVRSQGWAAWNVEYRRLGLLGGGGGWPATLIDVAVAVDHLHTLAGIDVGRVVVCGHSAGGQLALWAAGRSRLPPDAPGAGPVVVVRGAVALAGVTDLRRIASEVRATVPRPFVGCSVVAPRRSANAMRLRRRSSCFRWACHRCSSTGSTIRRWRRRFSRAGTGFKQER